MTAIGSRSIHQNHPDIVDVGQRRARSAADRRSRRRTRWRRCCRDRPWRRGRAISSSQTCFASMIAPAGSAALPAPPSAPSVSAASAEMPEVSLSRPASASAYSWLGPPRPLPRTVTVSSPPDRIAMRLPSARASQREPGVIGGDAARLALEVGAEIDDLVAGVPCHLDRGLERGLRPRDQLELRARKGGIAGLAAFVCGVVERAADGVVDLKAVFRDEARASASVVGSGTVGPEAIAEGSSCGTSEIASVTISARFPARASRPPLIRDRCLRTVLTSPIGAPERNSARVTCCFCAKDTPVDRRDPVGGAAARQQHQQQIVGTGACGAVAGFPPRPSIRPRRARDGRLRSP